MNLPGIGTFEADSTVSPPDENDKQKPSYEGISFRNTPVTQADDDLIEYIKVHTGKMKPLAISDLESYLTLGKQFLFIGKPFHLEGIGTLSLTREGQFVFTPGEFVTTKLEDPNVERSEGKKRSVYEEDRLSQESKRNAFKIVLLALGVILAIGAIGYGGYYFYTLYSSRQPSSASNSSIDLSDSTTTDSSSDSLFLSSQIINGTPAQPVPDQVPVTTRLYKFVVLTTDDKLRATNFYNFYGNNIQWDNRDSNLFKLFFSLPATPDDTLRIRDSLNKKYYPTATTTRVTIE